MSRELADALVATLPAGRRGLFNPWRESCEFDTPGNGPEARLERLALHLDCSPRFILVGEAPGYQGCRYSGVAFTSERLLIEGAIPRMPASLQGARLTTRPSPFSEPSATIVWKNLYDLGLAEETLLWNAVQLHPHRELACWSNRTPSQQELELGKPALGLLREAFPRAVVVAVGQKADQVLRDLGMPAAGCIRHPANGGATLFAQGLRALSSGAYA